MTSDLKKLDSFTLETSKNRLVRNCPRNGRVRVKRAQGNVSVAKPVHPVLYYDSKSYRPCTSGLPSSLLPRTELIKIKSSKSFIFFSLNIFYSTILSIGLSRSSLFINIKIKWRENVLAPRDIFQRKINYNLEVQKTE